MDHHHQHHEHHRFLNHRYVLPPPPPPLPPFPPPPPLLIADDRIPAAVFHHNPPYHPSSPSSHQFHHRLQQHQQRELDHCHHHLLLHHHDRVNPNLWDRRPLPPPLMIQETALDGETRRGPVEGWIDVERMSPCLPAPFEWERMSPPSAPLVRVDRGRGEYDIGVSRLRDERHEWDESCKKLGDFGMNGDLMERGLSFGDYRGCSHVKLREIERNSVHIGVKMMLEDQGQFVRVGRGDMVDTNGRLGETRSAGFEQDRDRRHFPFRVAGAGIGQDNDGVSWFYDRGKNVVLESERNVVCDRKGVQEHNHTPRKKVTPKKSVLLRMQRSKNSFRNKIDNDSGGSQERVREEREGSPVELDVSFKSNALVAKAVKAPLASVVVSDGSSSPKNLESKDMSSEVSGLVSQLGVVSEIPAKINSYGVRESERDTSVKDEKHLEVKPSSSSLKETNHVSNFGKNPSTSKSLSAKSTRLSPQVVASDKEGEKAIHLKASPPSLGKKRKVTRPPSSGQQKKVEDSTTSGTLLSSLPGNPLSNNYGKTHEDLTSHAKFTVDNDAGLGALAMKNVGLVDESVSEGSSHTNRKGKKNVSKDLLDSFCGAGNEGVVDPEGSVDDVPPISNSDELASKSPDKSSSTIGDDGDNVYGKSLDLDLPRDGCGDGSSEFLLPAMIHFEDRSLDFQNNMIHDVQPCADSSICAPNNLPVDDFLENICFSDILTISSVRPEISKEQLPVASDSEEPSIVNFSVDDGNVTSEIGGKQSYVLSEMCISEASPAAKFAAADGSNWNDIKIRENQSSAQAYSFTAGVALCSGISAADAKESTTDLNDLDTIHKHPLGGTFAVSSNTLCAEASLDTSVHIELEGHFDIGDDCNSSKKRKAEAGIALLSSMTDNVDKGSIIAGANTFSRTVEAEQPAEDRIAGYGCSIDSKPCSDESYTLHGSSMTDSFMAQSAVSAFNSDSTVAFPPCKKQKGLPQQVCSNEILLELHGSPASTELPVVDMLVLSHPTGDSVELGAGKQAMGSVPAFECISVGLTEIPDKSAVYGTHTTFSAVVDEFNKKVSESDPSSFDPCAIVQQSSLANDRFPCLSESGECDDADKCCSMDSANYKNELTGIIILGASPDKNGLDDGDVKVQHNVDLQVELLEKDSECRLSAKYAAEHQSSSPLEDKSLSLNCSELCTEPTHFDGMAVSSCNVDAPSDVVNQESRCTLILELPTIIAAVADNTSSDLKLPLSHPSSNDESSLVGQGPPMSMPRAFTRTSNMKLKSNGVGAGSGHQGTTSSLSSQAAKRTWPSNATSKVQYDGKNALNYPGRRVVAGRPFIAKPSSKKTSTTYNMKSRTWHRTDESAASNLSVKGPSSNTIPPRVPLFKKSLNILGNTYIRKGTNSLVRTPAAAAVHGTHGLSALPDRSNHSTTLNARSNGGSASEPELNGASSGLCTEGDCIRLEMPKTPPLPCSNNLLPRNVVSLECGTLTAADASVAAEKEVLKASSEGPTSSHLESSSDKNMKEQCVGSDGYIDSGNENKLVYGKSKSNQLVAASTAVDSVVLQPFSSSNRYFKRNKNQLVRASSKRQIRSAVTSSKATSKHRKSSLVWTLHDSTSSLNKGGNQLHCRKFLPNVLPWKRSTWWRSLLPSAYLSNPNSIPLLRRKLLSSKKRAVIYTRSGRGFTLRRSKVVSVGGRSLKWSKSIEKHSRKAIKAAALAVPEMEGKKDEKVHTLGGAKKESSSRDRIFRIGMFRYRMENSGRTLQRISDEEPTSSAAGSTARHGRKPYVPKRLLIGNDEYVQVGNGNQLIRDPKRRIRILASEKVRWSLHTARMRLVKKKKYCLFFTKFGKCNKDEGKCPYIHDSSKIAVCTKYLNGICFDLDCTLTHQVIPERMPDCSFFLQGMCCNRSCPYRHINVNPKAGICENFLKGYCADGNECRKKHSFICPAFEATGSCPDEPKCKLYHPRRRKVNNKRSSKDQKTSWGRYFGLGDANFLDLDSSFPRKLIVPKSSDDIFLTEGRYADYIGLDVSDEEVGEDDEESVDPSSLNENEPSCALPRDLDELIKPVRILGRRRVNESPSASTSSRREPSNSVMSVL